MPHLPPTRKAEPDGGKVNSVSAMGVDYDNYQLPEELCFGTKRVRVQTSQDTFLPARTEKVVLGQVDNITQRVNQPLSALMGTRTVLA